ncbi:hypothetical protein [Streptomyces sp. NPDC049881]|uniref:hypothetical protein n=1 Tax=Streptomyces sp. NPDC049881 TaxID=3155778 RepID=UPI00343BABBE
MKVPTTLTRLLGASVYACVAYALALVLFRHGAPRPHVNIMALGVSALAAATGWIFAVRTAPPVPPSPRYHPPGGTPAPPRRLPSPRPAWARTAGAVLTAAAVLAAVVVGTQPGGEHGEAVNAIQRAGAQVATGAVVRPPTHVEVQDFTHERRHVYRADLVLELDTPHGPRHVKAYDARTVALPRLGEAHQILYAPSAPGLGAYVDEMESDLGFYTRGWGLPPTPVRQLVLLGLIPFTLLVGYRLLVRRLDPASRVLQRDARDGRVRAVRVTIEDATGDPVRSSGTTLVLRVQGGQRVSVLPRLLRDPAGPGRADDSLLYMGRAMPGMDAWLCMPVLPSAGAGGTPVAVVADGGRTVWGRVDPATGHALGGHSDPRATGDDRWCAPAPRLAVFRPGLHLPQFGLLCAAFALVLPGLLHIPGEALSSALGSGAALLIAASAAWPLWWGRRSRSWTGAQGWLPCGRDRSRRAVDFRR